MSVTVSKSHQEWLTLICLEQAGDSPCHTYPRLPAELCERWYRIVNMDSHFGPVGVATVEESLSEFSFHKKLYITSLFWILVSIFM
jgi:hypothetical protein